MVELTVTVPSEVGLGYRRTVFLIRTGGLLFKESEKLFCTEKLLLVSTGLVIAGMLTSDKRNAVQNNFMCIYKGLIKRRATHLSCSTAFRCIATIQSPSKTDKRRKERVIIFWITSLLINRRGVTLGSGIRIIIFAVV